MILAHKAVEAIAGQIWDVARQRGALGVHGLAQDHPADMRPPWAFFRCMRIAGVVAVLVMYPVHRDPEDRSALKSKCGADGHHILDPLGSLKAAMGEQAVIADADADVDGQDPEDGRNREALPTEEEESDDGAKMEGGDEAGGYPVDAAAQGFPAHADLFAFLRLG